jgi:Zn finger protein HypA/HybF involved in hydrogenase expression
VELRDLQEHIRELACLSQTPAPVISCYLRVDGGRLQHPNDFTDRVEELRQSFQGEALLQFEEALEPIEQFLSANLNKGSQGVAVFSRGGRQPLFMALQFYVPLPTWLAADTLPNIYHLCELKDTYWRFVVLVCSQDTARIIVVNLGAVTRDLLRQRPELRRRAGREWTKEHFRRHRTTRTQGFVGDLVGELSRLMTAGGFAHLILVGEPRMTAMVRRSLPSQLAARLCGVIRKKGRIRTQDVVADSIESFVETENKESQAAAEELQRQIQIGGLAVAGTRASYWALKRGEVETLVMGTEYSPHPGSRCRNCRLERPAERWAKKCPACGSHSLEEVSARETMLRLAEHRGFRVELVRNSPVLDRLGGVGCLLRFRAGPQGKTRPKRRPRRTAPTLTRA